MPIPVSVTGFTNNAGAQSQTATSVHIEQVLPGSQTMAVPVTAPTTVPKAGVGSPAWGVCGPDAAAWHAAGPAVPIAATREPVVHVNDLTFSYPATDGRPIPGAPMMSGMNLKLYQGECSLLLGANGAGKTTLLKIMGGYHMIPKEMVHVLDQPPFHATRLTMSGALSYIGGSWTREVAFAGSSVPLQGDFSAGKMIEGIQGVDPKRREEIMDVLDVNPNWRMHQVSDGQRRRVQLTIGLLKPFEVLLLDEITVDLDVLGRADLLDWLKKDAKKRNACIFYATHIFDGLEDWFDSIAFVSRGQMQFVKQKEEMPEVQTHGLLATVSGWLRTEKTIREEIESKMAAEEKINPSQKPDGTYAYNNGYSSGTLVSSLAPCLNPSLAGSSNMVWRN